MKILHSLFVLTFLLFITNNNSLLPRDSSTEKTSTYNRLRALKKKISSRVSSKKKKIEKKSQKTKANLSDIIRGPKVIFNKEPKRNFCPVDPNRVYAPTINDPEVIQQDTEGIIPLIKKYSPIMYLFNERYYPVAAEDYFLDPQTSLVYRDSKGNIETVIPAGEVTMEKIYENRTKHSGNGFYFDIKGCTKYGSNPERFSDDKGNLTTPIYVTWSEHEGKLYIGYIFAYAFNGAYPITAPVSDLRLVQTGDHEFDLEYVYYEIDAQSKKLERIYFSAHTSREGVWMPADHKDILYEGTHPIIHVAHNGHGSYPRAGTHVRIFGFANDITSRTHKAHRWIPQMVLIYPDSDARFNPKTMGWTHHSGSYGRRGVDSFKRFIGETCLEKGRPYEKVLFCPNPENPKDSLQWLKYRLDIARKRIKATIP